MANYDVRIEDLALKELQFLNKPFVTKIFQRIESLSANPRPSGSVKLTGFDNLYRVRSGDYRVVYSINDVTRKVVVLRVRHRKDVYKGL